MTSKQLCYLAGLIDGEGSISLVKVFRQGRPSYRANITIEMTAEALIRQVHAEAGFGKVYKYMGKGNRRPTYRLWFGPGPCRRLLPALKPYLRLKAPHAEALQRYLDH